LARDDDLRKLLIEESIISCAEKGVSNQYGLQLFPLVDTKSIHESGNFHKLWGDVFIIKQQIERLNRLVHNEQKRGKEVTTISLKFPESALRVSKTIETIEKKLDLLAEAMGKEFGYKDPEEGKHILIDAKGKNGEERCQK